MEQKREDSPTPRSLFTRELRNHRKRQAEILAFAVRTELKKAALTDETRWITLGLELDRWLKDPHLIELPSMGRIIGGVNNVLSKRNQDRRLRLSIRAKYQGSDWVYDFAFCEGSEPVPSGNQLSVVRSYHVPDVCTHMSDQFFRPKGGIPFARRDAAGLRLREHLRKVGVGVGDFPVARQTGDLIKVTFSAKVLLHLRVTTVDTNGVLLAEYGEETPLEETESGGEEPAGRRTGFAEMVGELVTSMAGVSPPGLRAAES